VAPLYQLLANYKGKNIFFNNEEIWYLSPKTIKSNIISKRAMTLWFYYEEQSNTSEVF
jgi:hypothetical protein